MTEVDVDVELAAKRADIETQLSEITAASVDASSSIGFGKRVGEGTSVAVERLASVAVHDRLTAMLTDVKRAQQKRVDGSYGRCDVCDASIPQGRLEALPWATLCLTHAEERNT